MRFNSRTLGRVRPISFDLYLTDWLFQFTHPGKGATHTDLPRERTGDVSIHAPWEGCDSQALALQLWLPRFNSRTLGRVRRVLSSEVSQADKVSIHAPWEGCDLPSRYLAQPSTVSIHAPWEGCDMTHIELKLKYNVSIHAPWEGCDEEGR